MDLFYLLGGAAAVAAYVFYSKRRDTLPFPPSPRDLDDPRRAKRAEQLYDAFVQLLLEGRSELNAARSAGVQQVKAALLLQGLFHYRRGGLGPAQIKMLADGYAMVEHELGGGVPGGGGDFVRRLDALVSADVLARGVGRAPDDALHAIRADMIAHGRG